MTNRVPVLNLVVPFLILYPIPNDIFGGILGKILLSIIIFGGLYYPNLQILKCRLRKTKFLLILLGIFMAFSRTQHDFILPFSYQSEIIASIDSNDFYQTKSGKVHKTVKITKIQESKNLWHGKDVIIDDPYGLFNKVQIFNEFITVKGIIFTNNLNLPTFTVNKIIKIKNIEIIKLINERKNILIEKFWNDSKASPNTKSFMIAFATGSKKYIDDKFKNTYIKTGVMHLFAVSGLHFGILYFLLKFIIEIFSVNKFVTTFSIISILFLYLSVIGFPYSAQRAFLMILIWEISNLLFKNKCVLTALSLTFVLTSLFQPTAIYEPGFQLSFTIVLLIIWFTRGIFNLGESKSVYAYFFAVVKCSFAAFCGSFFILLGSFGQIVPISIISNIILVPFAFSLMIIFIIYFFNFYLLSLDLYLIVDFIYTAVLELLLFLNGIPFSYFSFDLQVDNYLYIILPILVIFLYNKNLGFFLKLFITLIVSLFSVFFALCL